MVNHTPDLSDGNCHSTAVDMVEEHDIFGEGEIGERYISFKNTNTDFRKSECLLRAVTGKKLQEFILVGTRSMKCCTIAEANVSIDRLEK